MSSLQENYHLQAYKSLVLLLMIIILIGEVSVPLFYLFLVK